MSGGRGGYQAQGDAFADLVSSLAAAGTRNSKAELGSPLCQGYPKLHSGPEDPKDIFSKYKGNLTVSKI